MSVRAILDLPFQFSVNVSDQKVWHGPPSFDIIDIIIASNMSSGFRSLREYFTPFGLPACLCVYSASSVSRLAALANFLITRERLSLEMWSMKSTPLRWSISCCGPLDLLVIFRNRQAAFLVGGTLLRGPQQLRIDINLGVLRLVLLGKIRGDNALRDADLDRREPDSGRAVHGLEHVLHKLADLRVDLGDRLGDQPQTGIRQGKDGARRHGRRCKSKALRGQCMRRARESR